MANTREAFERLLSSIPRYPSEDKFDPSFAMKLYTHLERRYNSELFNQDMLHNRQNPYVPVKKLVYLLFITTYMQLLI